ncbi:MAG: PspC domain-containing protein [Alphaproteobacteria bacterium]
MSTAVNAIQEQAFVPSAPEKEPALPLRSDTILGVCEAVGEDLGFHPNWLRIPFAALILWNPPVIIAAYLLLGLVVAATRWLFPVEPKTAGAKAVERSRPEPAAEVVDADEKELLAA